MTSPQPPSWAQSCIAMLVPAGRRDSIVGDLLEEYLDARLPQFGRVAADRWFVRQSLGFVWAASILPGVLVGAILTGRMLLDVAMPVPDTSERAWVSTLVTMLLFTLTGFRVGLSTRRVPGAIVTALAATCIGIVLSYAGVLVSMGIAQAFVHPGAEAWASLREGLDVPAPVIAVVGAILACAGAAIGRSFPKWPLPVSG
jgi:hypothetical protein